MNKFWLKCKTVSWSWDRDSYHEVWNLMKKLFLCFMDRGGVFCCLTIDWLYIVSCSSREFIQVSSRYCRKRVVLKQGGIFIVRSLLSVYFFNIQDDKEKNIYTIIIMLQKEWIFLTQTNYNNDITICWLQSTFISLSCHEIGNNLSLFKSRIPYNNHLQHRG